MGRGEEVLDALCTLHPDGTEADGIVIGRLLSVADEEDAVVVRVDAGHRCAEREQRGEDKLGGEHDENGWGFGRVREIRYTVKNNTVREPPPLHFIPEL